MTTQYIWTQSAIDSLVQNDKLSEFNNPAVNTVMDCNQLQTWKIILNDSNLTFDKLANFDLVVENPIIVKKIKRKQKKVVKKKK